MLSREKANHAKRSAGRGTGTVDEHALKSFFQLHRKDTVDTVNGKKQQARARTGGRRTHPPGKGCEGR